MRVRALLRRHALQCVAKLDLSRLCTARAGHFANPRLPSLPETQVVHVLGSSSPHLCTKRSHRHPRNPTLIGQTGSGKTFTITGGAERYADRGIIPRTLAYIFEQFGKRSDRSFEAKVSYLEIYNEVGFDLLDPDHEITKMEDLPKVELLDTGDGEVFLKNLSQNPVSSEEDALNALFVGDTNRMIAETPMNQASTRSHCIFTIHLSSRPIDGSTIRRAKLHLVDLAGSERIGKTGVAGTLATEAKYINLSLHYLEQVIVALSEKSRSHIPYRSDRPGARRRCTRQRTLPGS